MARLLIRLLGPYDVTLDGEPVTIFSTDKVRALLAYLAMNPDQHHRRETLAGLLWGEYPESSARASLRNALGNLRRAIGDHDASPPYLTVTRQTICFEGGSDHWLDAAQFSAVLASQHPEPDALERAVAVYRGPFLQGFSTPDSPAFEEWLLLSREQLSRQIAEALRDLVLEWQSRGEYDLALPHARRLVELDPWREEAHRQLMLLLTYSGQRTAALNQYQACRRLLAGDLGIEPEPETTRLYEQIRAGEHRAPEMSQPAVQAAALGPVSPAFLTGETDHAQPPLFVSREEELAWLEGKLGGALSGQGQVAFVVGGPGRGKSSLLNEFARRAMEAHPQLLVASGACNAYSGAGDPYLPFREVLAMLTGDVEASYGAGAISRDHALRLWSALPLACQALVDHGPHLAPALIPCLALLDRAARAAPAGAPWLQQLSNRIDCSLTAAEILEESDLFQQVTNLLRALSREQPLLLIVDDLQWVDSASAALLFHLGRRLAGGRILIAGAYRPEETTSLPDGIPHPLRQVLGEFRRQYGDILLDLAAIPQREGRLFVESLLDSESNRLGDDFRSALFAHTSGHPLFTVELLRTMQERGDLVQDQAGAWVEGPALHWDALPPRVEGIVQARIGRLDRELRDLLAVASVEGEAFTAQVIAQVQGLTDRQVLHMLSQELEGRHHLVREHSVSSQGSRWLARYRFGHALFQQYLYQSLGEGERALLHGEIAGVLEDLHQGQLEGAAAVLAHHYAQAHDHDQALKYFALAGDVALAAYASREAEVHFRKALELEPSGPEQAQLLSQLGEALARQNRFIEALAIWQEAIERHTELGDSDAVARLYARSGWAASESGDETGHLRLCLEGLDAVGEAVDSPGRARLLHETALAYMNQAKREESEPFALRALEMAERLGHPELLSQALATWSSAARHSLDESIPLVQRALALAEENGLLLAGMRAHLHLGYRYRYSAQIERARGLQHFRRVVEMAGQAGLTATQCTALTELARDHLRAGELDEAGELLAQARLLLGDLNEPTTAAAMVDSAEMQRVGFMGRWSDCTNMARALRASTRDRGAARTTAFAAIYLGWSLLEPVRLGVAAPSGDWSEAESAFEEATELFDSSFSPSIGIRTRGQWAYLRLLQGKLADAQRLLAEGNEAAAAFVTPPATEGHRLWLAAEVAVVMGNWPEAMSLFEEACEAIVQSDEHWWTARVRLSWAQAHLTRAQPGDRQRAAELYRAAHDAFQNMGAEGYAAVARDRLQQLEAAQS